MNAKQLGEQACLFFEIPMNEFVRMSKKCSDKVAIARHVARYVATQDYKIPIKELTLEWGAGHSVVSISKSMMERGMFEKELAAFRDYLKKEYKRSVDVVVGENGITRITAEAFDERFYQHPTKINPRTGNNFFPAFHFIMSLGAPSSPGLDKWKQDKGHFADFLLTRSAEIGTFVHNSIDNMLRHNIEITHEEIHKNFTDPKEAQRVKECLLAAMTWMAEEEPIIISSEDMGCGEDFGFTMDLKCRIKSDNYKNVWIVDWKTSKVATDDHKMQVEVMRRETESDKGAVIILGNSTKKGYTVTEIPDKKKDYLYNRFLRIKDVAYMEIIDRGLVKPREDNMPKVFSFRNIKIQKL